MTSSTDNMPFDYTRVIEAVTAGLIIGAAIIISTMYQAEQANARAARSWQQRHEIDDHITANGTGIADLRKDLAHLKVCRPG